MDNPEDITESQQSIEDIVSEDGRYTLDAFSFLHKALNEAVEKYHPDPADARKHVTGRQLCLTIVELARRQWGLMAPAVFHSWNVHESLDFGHMVYLMIEHHYMRKTEEDRLDDFRDVFDMETAFDITDEIHLAE